MSMAQSFLTLLITLIKFINERFDGFEAELKNNRVAA